ASASHEHHAQDAAASEKSRRWEVGRQADRTVVEIARRKLASISIIAMLLLRPGDPRAAHRRCRYCRQTRTRRRTLSGTRTRRDHRMLAASGGGRSYAVTTTPSVRPSVFRTECGQRGHTLRAEVLCNDLLAGDLRRLDEGRAAVRERIALRRLARVGHRAG